MPNPVSKKQPLKQIASMLETQDNSSYRGEAKLRLCFDKINHASATIVLFDVFYSTDLKSNNMGNGQIRRHFGVAAELTALQPLFFACYSLAHYSKWACTFDNNGCANYFIMEGKMLKKVPILTCPDQKLIC